jgi:hypothetical protein
MSALALFVFLPSVASAQLVVEGMGNVVVENAVPVRLDLESEESPFQMRKEQETRKEAGATLRANGEPIRAEVRAEAAGVGIDQAQLRANESGQGALDRVELRLRLDEGEETASATPVRVRSEVRTQADLEEFIRGKARADANLRGVEVKEGLVEVEYAQPAKFLGIFRTNVSARARVASDDAVEITYPWYHIFMKKEVSKESLRANIARALAAERKALSEGMSTTTTQATIAAGLGIPDIFDIILDAFAGRNGERSE